MEPKSSQMKLLRKSIPILCMALFAVFLAYKLAAKVLNNTEDEERYQEADGTAESKSFQAGVKKHSNDGRNLEMAIVSMNHRQNELEEDISNIEERLTEKSESPTGEAGEDLSIAEQQQEEVRKMEEQIVLLEDTLEEEATDINWSADAVSRINTVFGEVGILKNLNSRCQSTMCRIDMEFENEYRSGENMNYISTNLPWNGMIFYRLGGSGKQATVYLSREGYELPKMEM